ncbi:MAG: hypothetical protein JWO25_2509, partial [Alphaproteobacteria bacterium]|nr:hypothetical protein [Alphaproteobacteria bacterium]
MQLSNWQSGTNPVGFELDYDDCLRWYAVPDGHAVDVFDCAHAAVLDGTDRSDLKPFYRHTNCLDTFKDMIGLPDDFIRDGRAIAPEPRDLHFDPRMQDPDQELSGAEMQTVAFAAQAFIFGDSLSVGRFRRAIEARMSPFNVAVYAAR